MQKPFIVRLQFASVGSQTLGCFVASSLMGISDYSSTEAIGELYFYCHFVNTNYVEVMIRIDVVASIIHNLYSSRHLIIKIFYKSFRYAITR